jgi:hypothetical protein
VEAEERHRGSLPPPGRPVAPAVGGPPRAGYTGAVIAFYSRRLGCLGSVALSVLLTACLIVLFLLL